MLRTVLVWVRPIADSQVACRKAHEAGFYSYALGVYMPGTFTCTGMWGGVNGPRVPCCHMHA